MDNCRLNASSATAAISSCHAPYRASESLSEPLRAAPGEMRADPLRRDPPEAAESSPQGDQGIRGGDRISISPQARRLYDASAPLRNTDVSDPQDSGQASDASMSKNRRLPRFVLYRQDGGDAAGLSHAPSYPAPDASTEATPFSAHASASASASPYIHRAESGTLEHAHAGFTTPRRLYRVA
jgi:hypothetical protein